MALKVPNPYQPTGQETVNVNGTTPSAAKMGVPDISKVRTVSWTMGAVATPAFETKSATGVPNVVNGNPTSYTGNVTPEGAENPYTGGVETASPKGTLYGVNQGVYSPENKQKAWTAAGGAGTYNPDAFYRGTNGEMLIKEGAIPKQNAPVSTPATSAVSTPAVPSAATGITGISQVDTELDKLKKDKQKAIDDAYKSYELAKGSIEQNKGYYTNFDDVNARFTNVTNDVKNAMQAKGETFLTDDEYKKIADKYGIGLSEVKNPVSVFNALNLSDEGKTKLGVSKYDHGVADLKTAYERQKADIATSLANTERNMNAQIDDAANSINRNLGATAAQGAWSGAQRSTAYSQGLENVRSDGSNLIKRMNDQLANTQTQSHLEVSRLGEDLEKNLTRSKQDLDNQLQTMKFDNGLKLSEATAKYGTGSVELTKALDAIKEEFGAKSLDVYNKYLSSVKATNDLTTQKLEQISKIDDLTTKLADRRYNEYLANNGQLLTNTSLTNVHQELVNGTITPKRYDDLRNVMQNSVVSTLGKFGTVSEHDVNAISHMLDTGSTPTQIVAQMRGLPQYQKKVVDKVIDLGTKKRIQYADGSFEDVAETKAPISVGAGSEIYDPNTWTYVTRPSAESGTSTGTTLSGKELMKALASGNYGGKKFFGLYASGDPTGANRANAYEQMVSTGIGADLAKFPGTKITESMITDSANKYGIDPTMLATILKLDSSYGTKWKGSRNNNPGNVGQTDTLDAQGVTVPGYATIEEGVDAVSKNLKSRMDALVSANPSLAKKETSEWFEQSKVPLYNEYNQKGSLPTGMKFGTAAADKFISEASAYDKTDSQNKTQYRDLTDVILPEKASEYTKKSFSFGTRMAKSEKDLQNFEKEYKDSWAITSYIGEKSPNFMKSDDRQKFEQAQRDWVNANLRNESGAVISDSEFDNARKQYFPVPGDSESVIRQKRENRLTATKTMLSNAGRDENGTPVSKIFDSIYGQPYAGTDFSKYTIKSK